MTNKQEIATKVDHDEIGYVISSTYLGQLMELTTGKYIGLTKNYLRADTFL